MNRNSNHKSLTRAVLTLLAIMFAFSAKAETLTLNVGSGTESSPYVPVCGDDAFCYQKSEFIYQSTDLNTMAMRSITKMEFFVAQKAESSWGNARFKVYLRGVYDSSFESATFTDFSEDELVYEGPLDATGDVMEIAFDTPFFYDGTVNLLVGIHQVTPGTESSALFSGMYASSACLQGHSNSSLDDVRGKMNDFLPHTMFTYQIGSAIPKPTNITVSDITLNSAVVDWDSPATARSWQICVNDDESKIINVSKKPYTLEDLNAATPYEVKVRAVADDGNESNWSASASFFTLICSDMYKATLSYELTDSKGDGWNGNAINVIDDLTGAILYTLTIEDGTSASGSMRLCVWRRVRFEWAEGTSAGECSYVVRDPNDEEIFSGTGAMSEPVTYVVEPRNPIDKPASLQVTDLSHDQATLTWNWVAGQLYTVEYKEADEEEWTQVEWRIELPSCELVGLKENTAYMARVKAEGIQENQEYASSVWATVSFTTLVANPVPYDVAVSPSSNEATISWNGRGDSYEVRYRRAGFYQKNYFEDFEQGIPADWTTIDATGSGNGWRSYRPNPNRDSKGNPLALGKACATSVAPMNGGEAAAVDNWLISPMIDLKGTLSIWARGADEFYKGEAFTVYVSDMGNGIDDFIDELVPETRVLGEYTEYTARLDEVHSNRMGYIAIRHHTNEDARWLNVDDFALLGDFVEAGSTKTEHTTDLSFKLTGLAPSTTYEFSIVSLKQGFETASTLLATFKTTEEGAPTGLTLTPIAPQDNATWYTLDGRKLSGMPTKKGIYLKGNKKVVVK